MNAYLCYDLKGIQSFIFRIPRLRYVVGGSALIDQFDRVIAPDVRVEGATHLFSGGGKGAYSCSSAAAADAVEAKLRNESRSMGADIAFGRDPDFTKAAHCADKLYPALPDAHSLDGHPCPESGLFPVADGQMHPLVKRRKEARFSFEDQLLQRLRGRLRDLGEVEFFRDVSPDGEEGEVDAICAARALGNRNRWAVIAMDGNDMGRQFRALHAAELPEEAMTKRIARMSKELDDATRSACADAIVEVVKAWRASGDARAARRPTDRVMVLPVRPLVVGGDDLVVLCHASYALEFVKAACRSFTLASQTAAENYKKETGEDLWPATGGRMTISAGVLMASVSLPLATAIPYAESLLASAKMRGRQAGSPSATARHCAVPGGVGKAAVKPGIASLVRFLTRE